MLVRNKRRELKTRQYVARSSDKMPRKRSRPQLSYYDNPILNPEDRDAVDDHALVRHALVDFDELAVLPPELHKQLVADLVALAARQRRLAGVWGDSLVGVPRSCGELASAYLGFPF